MKSLLRRYSLWIAAAVVAVGGISVYRHLNVPATADDSVAPRALVQVTPLAQGSLPHIVTVYGSVGGASAARQSLVAQTQAQVSAVYVRDGALVGQGDRLLRLSPTPATAAAYDQAQAALNLADQLAQHTKALVASRLATDSQLLQAENDAANARLTLTTLRQQGADGPTTLTAPFPALVTSLSATPGAIMAPGDSLVQLTRPDRLELNAGVIPAIAGLVDQNDPVTLTPIGGGNIIAGTVVFRAATVDPADGLVPVDINVPAAQALLGEMFRADITVGQTHGYIVPHAAVLVDNTGRTYVVQDHDLTAQVVLVNVVGSDKDKDVITGALSADAPIILAGNYQLNDGDKIRLAKPGASGQ
jgi:membrane fusion protein, multidrug efflux system